MPRPPKPKPFPTEAALCAAFIAAIGPDWVAYAETENWDILLVRKIDGFQIGIQAKLRFGVDVINQAIEDGWTYKATMPMPDCRAVLVPDAEDKGFGKICDHLGLNVIRVRDLERFGLNPKYNPRFLPYLPRIGDRHSNDWHETATLKRHALPEYVPDVAAGAPSPLQLTDWKIKAIKLAVTLEMRKHLTRRDFAHHRVDHRRWVTQGWLKVVDGRFVKDAFPNFKKMHPVNYKQIRADAPKWLPKTLLEPVATQAAML
jgi:hypothetical protein